MFVFVWFQIIFLSLKIVEKALWKANHRTPLDKFRKTFSGILIG